MFDLHFHICFFRKLNYFIFYLCRVKSYYSSFEEIPINFFFLPELSLIIAALFFLTSHSLSFHSYPTINEEIAPSVNATILVILLHF